MKVIEVSNYEVRCNYCNSKLLIEPYDIMTESSHLGNYICRTYFICSVCKAPNYNVPDEFKYGAEKDYERRMKRVI